MTSADLWRHVREDGKDTKIEQSSATVGRIPHEHRDWAATNTPDGATYA